MSDTPDSSTRRQFDVFLSYSTLDKAVADRILEALESAGMACWVAARDIKPGDNWGSAIVRAIVDSGVMVVIYSANANESEHVLREVERAVDKKVKIVPVRIDNAPMSEDMEYFLSATHWFNAHEGPVDLHLEGLVDLIRQQLCHTKESAPAQGGFDSAAGVDALRDDETQAAKTMNAALAAMPHHADTDTPARPSPGGTKLLGAVVAVLILAGMAWIFNGPGGDDTPTTRILNTEWINMLTRIDVARDSVSANWSVIADGVMCSTEGEGPGVLALPYRPDGDYEFRIRFTRQSGNDSICQLFSLGAGSAVFEMDCWGETLGGIQSINYTDVRANETRQTGIDLVPGTPYAMTLRVEGSRFTGTLTGGDLNATWQYASPDSGRELSFGALWNVNNDMSLGIGCYNSVVVFHEIAVRPLR